ncbi:MAG: hypothetical protein VSS75_023425 [Candidatus Parabeggiatoa sp.]|nr:hypothetical protein [Candidatus Parabeggiatoa sp.]
MKRQFGLVFLGGLLLASAINVQAIEQTICFSQEFVGSQSKLFPNGVPIATLGDDVNLYGGKCQGAKLADMNRKGWQLTFVITGLKGSFGMVFDRVRKGGR